MGFHSSGPLSPLDSPQVHFAVMALPYHRACRMVAESGGLARASRRPWLETALFTAPAGNSPLS